MTGGRPRRSPSRLRRVGFGLLVALDVIIGAAGVGTAATRWPILHPRLEPAPSRAQAIVMLSGDNGDRLRAALDLMDRQVAPTLVLAGGPDYYAVLKLCQTPQRFEVVCLDPRPDNTRAEARALAELAARRGWDQVVVVTSVPHVTRARLLFERCVHARVRMVGSEPPPSGRQTRAIRHEWLGYLYALTLARSC